MSKTKQLGEKKTPIVKMEIEPVTKLPSFWQSIPAKQYFKALEKQLDHLLNNNIYKNTN